MKPSENISLRENKAVLKLPAYISLLAPYCDYKADDIEEKSTIKCAYINTYFCDPILAEFYKKADKVFEKNISQLDIELPKEKEWRKAL